MAWVPRITKRRGLILLIVLLPFILLHFFLDVWATHYVNRVLGNINGYRGTVANVSIHLYRGAYQLEDLKIYKVNGNIPTPFVDIPLTDLSIEWRALFQGRIVSEIVLTKPVLNFAVSANGQTKQTGKEGNWQDTIHDLMPIDINSVTLKDGAIHYRDFSAKGVDLFITQMNGILHNLRNVEDKTNPLPARITITGNSIGDGKVGLDGKLNILSEPIDMDIGWKLEHASLPAINNYSRDTAGIDFEKGKLNVYSEMIAKKGKLKGYIKPIATDVHVISLKNTNPVKLVWETLASVVIEIFTNQRKDQFATQIDLEGDINHPQTDTWSAIYGIIRNAYVKAFSRNIANELKEATH
jgi:hypothetical protein